MMSFHSPWVGIAQPYNTELTRKHRETRDMAPVPSHANHFTALHRPREYDNNALRNIPGEERRGHAYVVLQHL